MIYDHTWKKNPPIHLPPIGSLIRVEGWNAEHCIVLNYNPMRNHKTRPNRWRVMCQNLTDMTGRGWVQFPHEEKLLIRWMRPFSVIIFPVEGEPYYPFSTL